MKKIIISIISGIALSALFLTSCNTASKSNAGALNVLASTSFLADIAQNVAGDRAQVTSLVPIGADPHEYQAAPSDVAKITASNVLILNGIEYEHFIKPLLDNAGGERLIITASDGLEPRTMEDEENAGQVVGDPHMWLDVNRAIKYVENIRDGLIADRPQRCRGIQSQCGCLYCSTQRFGRMDYGAGEDNSCCTSSAGDQSRCDGLFLGPLRLYGRGHRDPQCQYGCQHFCKTAGGGDRPGQIVGRAAIFLGEVENPNLANQIAAETGVKVIGDLHLEFSHRWSTRWNLFGYDEI